MSRLWRTLCSTSTTPESDPTPISIGNGKLPVELLDEVFSHLTFLDLIACRLTCRLWSQTSYPSFQALLRNRPQIDNRTDGAMGYYPDPDYPAKAELNMKVTVTLKHSDNGPTHDLHIGWFSSSPYRLLEGIRLNPVLSHTSLEALKRRHQSPTWSLFGPAKWPPQMPITSPPTSPLDILVIFDDSLKRRRDRPYDDITYGHSKGLSRSCERVSRWGGLRVDDVARCVARQVDELKKEILEEEAVEREESRSRAARHVEENEAS